MRDMSRDQFKLAIKEQLESRGYKKISISLKFFGLNAVVTCVDKARKKHTFEVTTAKKHGELYCQYRDISSADWVDGLEALHALFDDE